MLGLSAHIWTYIIIFVLGFVFAMWLFRNKGSHSIKWPQIDEVNKAINRPPMIIPQLNEVHEVIPEPPRKILDPPQIDDGLPEEDYVPLEVGTYNLNPVSRSKRSVGEIECCRVMEELTGKPFITVRPTFLTNPKTGRSLELDCYNDDLRIAIEYNGAQHYNYTGAFGQSREQFLAQAERDIIKVDLCDKFGIYLITVPYHVQKDQIKQYIVERLPGDL